MLAFPYLTAKFSTVDYDIQFLRLRISSWFNGQLWNCLHSSLFWWLKTIIIAFDMSALIYGNPVYCVYKSTRRVIDVQRAATCHLYTTQSWLDAACGCNKNASLFAIKSADDIRHRKNLCGLEHDRHNNDEIKKRKRVGRYYRFEKHTILPWTLMKVHNGAFNFLCRSVFEVPNWALNCWFAQFL